MAFDSYKDEYLRLFPNATIRETKYKHVSIFRVYSHGWKKGSLLAQGKGHTEEEAWENAFVKAEKF